MANAIIVAQKKEKDLDGRIEDIPSPTEERLTFLEQKKKHLIQLLEQTLTSEEEKLSCYQF